jgi:hypothetical protein
MRDREWTLHSLLCLLMALSVDAWAQPAVPEYALKAAYLYHFIQYTDWPQVIMQKIDVLQICVAQDHPLLPALAALNNKRAHNKVIAVKIMQNPEQQQDAMPEPCHVLVLAAGEQERPFARAETPGMLTVADTLDEPRTDVIITLFMAENRLVFAVNNTLARRSELKISSKLLRLARFVQ